jgi:hypothetical protein
VQADAVAFAIEDDGDMTEANIGAVHQVNPPSGLFA